MDQTPYVELKGITKSFGSVLANNNVDLTIRKGEIHAILGENGSGKSTLMNMLSGIYAPDKGEILKEGKPLKIHSPKDAIREGIGMIHQHFKLVDVFTAAENIILGRKEGFFLKKSNVIEHIHNVKEKYGLSVDPNKLTCDMSVSEKQTVEIVKALYEGANLLILDEPTAVLTPQEIKVLFRILREMKADGCAILIITHKLNEVMEISDCVTIMRKGESIATVKTSETNIYQLTEMMVGRPISLGFQRTEVDPSIVKPLLEVENLTVCDINQQKVLENIYFSINSGEILGVAGIAGSGQKELCEALYGLIKPVSGTIRYRGKDITGYSPKKLRENNIAISFVPEDRLGMGLIGNMGVADNLLVKDYKKQGKVLLYKKESRDKAKRIIKQYDVQTPSVHHPLRMLSGGNIQKVLLGREIDLNPELLITAYPVRGLDIGASYMIYGLLNEQKKQGKGVMFVGEDLDILLGICDRILVLSHGKVMGIVPAKGTTKEQIGFLMLGEEGDTDFVENS